MTCKCVNCNHDIWATDPTKTHQFHDKFCGWRGKLSYTFIVGLNEGTTIAVRSAKVLDLLVGELFIKLNALLCKICSSEGQDPPDPGEHDSYQVLLTVRQGPQVERASAKLTKTENGFSSVRSMSSRQHKHWVQDSKKGSESSWAALPVHSNLDGLIKYLKGDSAKMLPPMDDRTATEWVEPQADGYGERNHAQALQGAEHMLGMTGQDYFGHKLWRNLNWNKHVHPKVQNQLQDWALQDSSVLMMPARQTQRLHCLHYAPVSTKHNASFDRPFCRRLLISLYANDRHQSPGMYLLTFGTGFSKNFGFGTDFGLILCTIGEKSLFLGVDGLTTIQQAMNIGRYHKLLATYIWQCNVKGNRIRRVPRNKFLSARMLGSRNTWHGPHVPVGNMRKTTIGSWFHTTFVGKRLTF